MCCKCCFYFPYKFYGAGLQTFSVTLYCSFEGLIISILIISVLIVFPWPFVWHFIVQLQASWCIFVSQYEQIMPVIVILICTQFDYHIFVFLLCSSELLGKAFWSKSIHFFCWLSYKVQSALLKKFPALFLSLPLQLSWWFQFILISFLPWTFVISTHKNDAKLEGRCVG